MKSKILFIIGLSIILIISGCEKKPSAPEYDNPLDELNPNTGGDPFNLTLQIASGGILLEWTPLQVEPLNAYLIFRSLNDSDFTFIHWINDVNASSYVDTSVQNGYRYAYYICAIDGNGVQINSDIREMEIDNTPLLSIDDADGFASSRNINLTLLAFGAVEMQIGSPQVEEGVWEEYQTAMTFELPAGEGIKVVQARFVYDNGDTSAVVSDSIEPLPMEPDFNINRDSTCTLYREVYLYLQAEGENIECKFSEDSAFAGAGWLDYADSVIFVLSAGNQTKTVYGIFKNDFEIVSAVISDQITPQPVDYEMEIVPAAPYINSPLVDLVFTGYGAVQVKCNNSGDSSAVNWVNYQGQIENFNLGSGDGLKYAYAWFRNDFFTLECTDSVYLDTYCAIDSLYWSSNGGDTLMVGDEMILELAAENDQIGFEIGGTAKATLSGVFQDLNLNESGNGHYNLNYIVSASDYVVNGILSGNLCDRAGNNALPSSATLPITIITSWEATIGGLNDERGYSAIQCGDGGYIITGQSGNEVYLAKTDARGGFLWERFFNLGGEGMGECVRESEDGGLVVTGYYGASPNFNLFLLKTDGNGNELWNRTFGGNLSDYGYCLQNTPDGGYLICGSTNSYGGGYSDIWLVKTNSSGNEVWNRTFGSTNYESGYWVELTSEGGYIITGYTGTPSSSYIRLIKTDSNGNSEWSKSYNSSIDSKGRSVRQTGDGGYIIAGYTVNSDYDAILIKTDASGNKLWDEAYGGSGDSYGYAVEILNTGGYVIVGSKTSGSGSDSDLWVIKTDSFGAMINDQTWGETGMETGYSVQGCSDGGYIIGGETNSIGGGGFDAYLIKLPPNY